MAYNVCVVLCRPLGEETCNHGRESATGFYECASQINARVHERLSVSAETGIVYATYTKSGDDKQVNCCVVIRGVQDCDVSA